MTDAQKKAAAAIVIAALGAAGYAVFSPGTAEAQAAESLPKVASIAAAAGMKDSAVVIGYRPAAPAPDPAAKPIPAGYFATVVPAGLRGEVYATGEDPQAAVVALIVKLDEAAEDAVDSAKAAATEAAARKAAVDDAKK